MVRHYLLAAGLGVALSLAATSAAQADTQQSTPSLYERLGGLAPISVVVSDFIDALMPDHILNANPAIDASRQRVPAAYLKYRVTSMVCQATGGPCQYQGRTMAETHAHLNISGAEWERLVTVLKQILERYAVPAQETQELLTIVESTRADIVTRP